jgi:hypothetical protein
LLCKLTYEIPNLVVFIFIIIIIIHGLFDWMYLCKLLESTLFHLELVALRMFVHFVAFHLWQFKLMAITIIIAKT